MKKFKLLVIVVLVTLSGGTISAQKIFREGYIVKTTGETLAGLVGYSDKKNIPSKCIFKRFDIARTVVYSPGEITAFGYRNGNRYESREINGKVTFLEVLVLGKIVLYQKGSRYYIDKDQLGLVELKNGPLTYNYGDGQKEFKSLPDFLDYITEGKGGNIAKKFNVKNDIIRFIADYNKETGKGYNVFNRSITEKQFTEQAWRSGAVKNRFGIVSGLNLYKLNMSVNQKMFTNTSTIFVPVPALDPGMVAGLTFERLLFRKTDRISVKIDFLYNQHSFYSYSERKNNSGGTTRDDAWFKFTGIKAPILLQYSFTGAKIVPYISAGIAYQYFIAHDYSHTYEVENYLHEINTYEDQKIFFRKGEITEVGGLGVRTRIYNNLSIHLSLMVEMGQGLFQNINPIENMYSQSNPYIEKSFQSTILIGITF